MLKSTGTRIAVRLRALPTLAWVMAGFMLAYVLYFLLPVFLSGSSMRFPMVLPTMTPIGADLRETMTFVQAWLHGGGTPYIGTATYPPLSYALFAPLLQIEPSVRYVLFSILTVVCFGVAALWFPLKASGEKQVTPELLLVFATGLISYGLQFELERGQANVIAVTLALAAIWLFHSGKGRDLWAYGLFSLSVQLKLYPLVFILMFVRDWRDWKSNVKRLSLLILANYVLLFALGWRISLDFVRAVRGVIVRGNLIGIRNHSIHGFVGQASQIVAAEGTPWSRAHVSLLENEILAIVAICLALLVFKAWRENARGVNAELLLACSVSALVIPTVSYDYTLATLAGPVGLLLIFLRGRDAEANRRISIGVATMLFCFAYASTLLPLNYRPGRLGLQSSLPALVVMLLAVTFMAVRLRTARGTDAPRGADSDGAQSPVR